MVEKENWWDPEMSQELINHILLFELFEDMVKDKFSDHGLPASFLRKDNVDIKSRFNFDLSDDRKQEAIPDNPLTDLICKHTRIAKFKKGDIIIREGGYGSSAFFIALGKVAVILAPGLPDEQLGHKSDQKMGFVQTLNKLWSNPGYPEVRSIQRTNGSSNSESNINKHHLHLNNVLDVLKKHEHVELKTGDIFGEIGALGRTPRTTTVVATAYCELLEIRWQGLRDLRRLNQAFRRSIDTLYRKDSLLGHLYSLPLFANLSRSDIQRIAEDTSFKTYGSFEWQSEHKQHLENNALSLLKNDPLIFEENQYTDCLYIVSSGFARVSYQYNNGYKVLRYLGQGDSFGLETIIYNWKNKDNLPMQTSLHAVGYADILQVPSYIIERIVLSSMKDVEIDKYLASDFLHQFAKMTDFNPAKVLDFNEGVVDFMSDYRFVNGTSTMLIDTDRCTRCDECVMACAVGHRNNPRFNRHGQRYDHFMVANACMHCYDPVCLIDCPTGAIQRKPLEGQIVINDDICIGCSTCANSCPYENIHMVEARDDSGLVIRNQETHRPVLKATKCNLCTDQLGGPACERACPHDALKRTDILDLPGMISWMNR